MTGGIVRQSYAKFGHSMRIWDLHPSLLCRQHLLGEHRELHALYSILQQGKVGYRNHPETKRWVGKLPALKARHELLVAEMQKRGYAHHTPLPDVRGEHGQPILIASLEEQCKLLRQKGCDCLVNTQERV